MGIVESHPPVRIGCDLGQVDDPSTIALAEVTYVDRGRRRMKWIKHTLYTMTGRRNLDEEVEIDDPNADYRFPLIEQIALGTRYRDVARRIADIACAPRLAGRDVSIYCDQTGVGRPITEMLQDELSQRRRGEEIALYPITFVTGEEYNRAHGKMGKGYLAARLTLLMEQHLLHFPKDSPYAESLRSELLTFQRRMNERQHEQFGAFGAGAHDDLVIAVGLCTLEEYERNSGVEDEVAELLLTYRGY